MDAGGYNNTILVRNSGSSIVGTGSPVALIPVNEHPIKGDFPANHN
jgi:hypothetical protein